VVLSRRNLIYLAIADVVLFVIAAAFDNNSATSVDGVVWWVALLGLVLLVVLGVRAVVQSRRTR
jgi:uncharacterized membrane protein YhaH (DUF805 family)